MKTIIVTGAQGFVGNAVCKSLSHAGYRVVPVVRKNASNLKDAIVWDITEPYKGSHIRADYVVHCAGLVDDWASYKATHKVNVEGTKNILDASPDIDTLIYISSASVYDPANKEFLIAETSTAGKNLLNAYSRTKYEAEQEILNHISRSSKIILRPHVIYGDGDKKIVPRLLQAHRFGKFLVLGNGDNHISITHIDNLCLAIKNCIDTQLSSGDHIFNIADANPVKIVNLIEHIKQKYIVKARNLYIPTGVAYSIGFILEMVYALFFSKTAPLITRYVVHQMTSNHALSIEKAVNVLKYKPVKSFVDFKHIVKKVIFIQGIYTFNLRSRFVLKTLHSLGIEVVYFPMFYALHQTDKHIDLINQINCFLEKENGTFTIIGYSFGGIISYSLREDLYSKIDRIITIASPHQVKFKWFRKIIDRLPYKSDIKLERQETYGFFLDPVVPYTFTKY